VPLVQYFVVVYDVITTNYDVLCSQSVILAAVVWRFSDVAVLVTLKPAVLQNAEIYTLLCWTFYILLSINSIYYFKLIFDKRCQFLSSFRTQTKFSGCFQRMTYGIFDNLKTYERIKNFSFQFYFLSCQSNWRDVEFIEINPSWALLQSKCDFCSKKEFFNNQFFLRRATG